MEQVTRTAIDRVENSGIIFLDEIDKIAGAKAPRPDVSREACSVTSFDRRRHDGPTRATAWFRTDHICCAAARSTFRTQ